MKVEELESGECYRILTQNRLGRIACSLNNQPYIVPVNFVFDGKKHLCAFSAVGRTIKWMRENPLVCVEVNDCENRNDKTAVTVFGSFEELPDAPGFEDMRIQAYELLSKYPMWWQQAYGAGDHPELSTEKPVFFRIYIEKVAGQRTVFEDQEIHFEAPLTTNNQERRI